MQIQSVDINSISTDPKNARKHSAKNLKAIKGSLKEFGQQKPIVVGKKDKTIIAGNGTFAAAKALGWKKIDVVFTELDATKSKAFALADNRTAELAEWDDSFLSETLKELADLKFDLGEIGFDESFLKGKIELGNKGNIGDNDVPEVKKNIHNVQRGQVWKLGEHRLMCGDSTSEEDVAKLMDGKKADLWITDPPYGVSYKSNGSEDKHMAIANDSMPLDQMKIFWEKVARNAYAHTSDSTPYYWFACQGGDQMMMMMMSISDANWKVRHELIWVKDSLVMGRCDYHYQHEPIFYGWKKDGTHNWYSDRKQSSTLNFARPKSSDLHPTMKPVELVEYLMRNSSRAGDIVLETFCGSGTSIIAAEKSERVCFGMEFEPHYCSVIIERWQQFTGKKAQLLTEV